MRKQCTDSISKDFYKLMNNAVYGKTLENVFNRKNYVLTSRHNVKKCKKLMGSGAFLNEYYMGSNMIIMEMEKKKIIFDKPIAIVSLINFRASQYSSCPNCTCIICTTTFSRNTSATSKILFTQGDFDVHGHRQFCLQY